MSRYPRQVDREDLSQCSGGLNKIYMIDVCTPDLHQDLVACNRRRRYIVEYQGATELQYPDSFHAIPPLGSPVSLPSGRALTRAQSGSLVSGRPNSRSKPAMSAL